MLRHDGSLAAGIRVELACGDWNQATTAGPDGTFAFVGAPATPCTLVAQSPEDSSAGVSLDVPVAREEHITVILPAGITTVLTPTTKVLRIDRTSQVDAHHTLTSPSKVSGVASWSSGLSPLSPGARPDQWSVGATVTRQGPWGTLLRGSASARRMTGPTTLLSDVTGAAAPGSSMWSALSDPSQTMVWDVRLGVEKHWSVRGTDLTFFGDAYRSFQGGTGDDAAIALPAAATKGLRTGVAGRFGVKIGF